MYAPKTDCVKFALEKKLKAKPVDIFNMFYLSRRNHIDNKVNNRNIAFDDILYKT